MSYLRPLLKEEMEGGEGWDFLAMHVMENHKMFTKILEERDRRETIIEEQQERDAKMQQWLDAKM